MLGFGLLPEDGETGLELRWLHVGQLAPLEATYGDGPRDRGDRLRGAVRRDHDLHPFAVELIEGVEELLLELLGALEELDVVDQQHVEVAVAALEPGHGLGADGVDELVHERLGRDVADALVAEDGPDVVPDGVEQVSFPQAGRPVDEQRVVGAAEGLSATEVLPRGRTGSRRRSRTGRRCSAR